MNKLWIAAALLGIILLSGCSGGSDAGTDTTGSAAATTGVTNENKAEVPKVDDKTVPVPKTTG